MPPAARIVLSHLASAAVMLALILMAGESPRIFVYGFFFNYLYRLLTLRGLIALHACGVERMRGLARTLSRAPHPARAAQPVMVGEGAGARPGGLGAYLIVLAAAAFFTFVMVNVKDQEIVTPPGTIFEEVLAGLLAGGLWWLLDLVDRRIALRFGEPLWVNFGFNSSETTLLAVTVLTGGVASAVMGSPWPYFLVLLALKTWFDAWEETRYPRTAHAEGAILRD